MNFFDSEPVIPTKAPATSEAVRRSYDGILPLGDHWWEPRFCRFPLWGDGERPNGMYCGEEVEAGSSYCPFHHALCHAPEEMEGQEEA